MHGLLLSGALHLTREDKLLLKIAFVAWLFACGKLALCADNDVLGRNVPDPGARPVANSLPPGRRSTEPGKISDEIPPWESMTSARTPALTVQGVTSDRFQWAPGWLDVPIYLFKTYRKPVDAWIRKHQSAIVKYTPSIIRYIANWESEKNAAILFVPVALKYFHSF